MEKNEKVKNTQVTIFNSAGEGKVLEDIRMLDMVTNTSEPSKAKPDDVNAIIPLAYADTFVPYFRDSVIKNSFYCSVYREFKNLFNFISKSFNENYTNLSNINIEGISVKETKFPDNLQEIIITLTSKDIEEYVAEASFDNNKTSKHGNDINSFMVGVRDRNRKGVFIKKLMETLFADSYVFNSELGGNEGMYKEDNLSRCKLTDKGIKIKSLSDSASEFKGKFSNIKKIVIKIRNTFSPQYYLHGLVNGIGLLNTENFMKNRGRDSHKVSGDEIVEARNIILESSKDKQDSIKVINAYETILTGFMERYNISFFTKKCAFDNDAMFKHVEMEVEIYNKDFSSIKNLNFYPGFKPESNGNNDAKFMQSIRDIVISYCKYRSIEDKDRTSLDLSEKVRRIEKFEMDILKTSTSEISNSIKDWMTNCVKDVVFRFVRREITCSKKFKIREIFFLKDDSEEKVFIPRGYNGLANLETIDLHFTKNYIGVTPDALEKILKDFNGKEIVTFYDSESDTTDEEEVYDIYKLLGLYSPYHNKTLPNYRNIKVRLNTRNSYIWSLSDYEGTIELRLNIPVYLTSVDSDKSSNRALEFNTNLVLDLEMI